MVILHCSQLDDITDHYRTVLEVIHFLIEPRKKITGYLFCDLGLTCFRLGLVLDLVGIGLDLSWSRLVFIMVFYLSWSQLVFIMVLIWSWLIFIMVLTWCSHWS